MVVKVLQEESHSNYNHTDLEQQEEKHCLLCLIFGSDRSTNTTHKSKKERKIAMTNEKNDCQSLARYILKGQSRSFLDL